MDRLHPGQGNFSFSGGLVDRIRSTRSSLALKAGARARLSVTDAKYLSVIPLQRARLAKGTNAHQKGAGAE